VRRILGDDHPDVVRASAALAASSSVSGSNNSASTTATGDLLRRANTGDRAAWVEIVSRYEGLVRSVARSFRLRDPDIDDALQRTWLQLLMHGGAIRNPENLGGWLASIATRECLTIIRSNQVYTTMAEQEEVGDPKSDVESQVIASEQADRIRTVVALLPTRRRILVEALLAVETPSYADLSRRTGIPVGAIGPTRARVLRQLREEYERVDPVSGRRSRRDSRINAATIVAIVDDASSTA
jgi:RNA polymerase sigma factor (sigma-70 family)